MAHDVLALPPPAADEGRRRFESMIAAVPGQWDAALLERDPLASLLQSWGYGKVQTQEGWGVSRVAVAGGLAQVLLQGPAGFRSGYVPRGPAPANSLTLAALVEWARRERLVSLKVEPDAESELVPELVKLGFRPATEMHPRRTIIVQLGKDQAMLASFKPKHRYNIRLSLRKGVEVRAGEDAAELLRQAEDTGRRQRITTPSLAAYERRLRHLPWCRIYVAAYSGEPLAAIMVARFGSRAYYLFGGASGNRRELMPAYAVQWRAMRDARDAGCVEYDLWGVPPEGDPSHPWAGLWQFKSGFGGRIVDYCGAWELTLDARRAGLARRLRTLARLPRHAAGLLQR